MTAPEAPTRAEAEKIVAWLLYLARAEIRMSYEESGEERLRRKANGAAALEAAVVVEERLVNGREGAA